MEYEDYSTEDFLLDGYFRQWITCSDANRDSFWESWLVQHPEKKQMVAIARQILLVLLSLRKREEEISELETKERWLQLQMASAKQIQLPD